MRRGATGRRRVRQFILPASLFVLLFLLLLLVSGIHMGLLVLMAELKTDTNIQAAVPIVYWALVAVGITWYTGFRVRRAYEVPLRAMADAAARVAAGDFSVYVPPRHSPDKLDYLDIMFEDFNKMVAELGSIETLKTDFFTNVSHEIKTPIAIIQSNAELLQTPGVTEEEKQTCAENIRSACHRLSGLITNMLKLNKLEKQDILPMPAPYDLCEQLCRCALQFEELWEEKSITFEAEIEDRAMIEADEGLLELVWTNLLSNALKFTPEGGEITLSQTSDEETVTVSVRDTGCGMDEETVRHVFDKFYQGDTSHATEGNGLGLALVLRILQLLDGSITVQSELGEGSIFTVRLPRTAIPFEKRDTI